MSQPGAKWDVHHTGVFIHECIDQVLLGERKGTTFSKKAWKNIVTGFREKTGKNYTRGQLKNKWDSLKKEWRVWNTICSKETGITIDYSTNKVVADDEWWDRKIKANPNYKRFRYKGMDYANELRTLFCGQLPSGGRKFAPSSTQFQPYGADADCVYRPTMDFETPSTVDAEVNEGSKEGSGDSEDEMFGAGTVPNCGLSQDMNDISLGANPSNTGGSVGGSKRKRGGESVHPNKQKRSAAKEISNTFSTLVSSSNDRLKAFEKANAVAVPHGQVIQELLAIEEIAEDMDFMAACCDVMLDEDCRYMYQGVKHNKVLLLKWLKRRVDAVG